MITEFGKLLRKLRIDHSEILKDMAEKLGVSSAFLSAVETGKRNIPESWPDEIAKLYSLDAKTSRQLKELTDSSIKNVKFNIDKAGAAKRQAALVFARNFDDMTEDMAQKLINILQRQKPGE